MLKRFSTVVFIAVFLLTQFMIPVFANDSGLIIYDGTFSNGNDEKVEFSSNNAVIKYSVDVEGRNDKVFLVLALYNNNEKQLVDIVSKKFSISGLRTISADISLPSGDEYTGDYVVKAMLWSNLKKIIPLTKASVCRQERNWPEIKELADYISIEENTTTYYSPWLVNYHLTDNEQISYDYKGSEGGQRVTCGAVNTKNPNEMIIGLDTTAFYKTSDGGINWYPSFVDGMHQRGISSVIYHPDYDDVLFCTACSSDYTSVYQGIYKSTDGGNTWIQKHTMPNAYGCALKLFAFGDIVGGKRVIYAASYKGGVFASYDDGETWTSIGLEDVVVYNLTFSNGTLIATTPALGVMTTTNDGESWIAKNTNLPKVEISSTDNAHAVTGEIYDAAAFAVNPDNPDEWFLSCDYTLYKSDDAGETWNKLTDAPTIIGNKRYLKKITDINLTAKFPDGHRRMILTFAYISTDTAYYYSDALSTFNPVKIHNEKSITKNNHGFAKPILCNPDSAETVVFIANEPYKSVNGGADIYPSGSGFSGTRIMDWWINPDNYNDMILGTTDNGLYFSQYEGADTDFIPFTYYASEDKLSPNIRYGGSKSVNGIAIDPNNKNHILISTGNWTIASLKESYDKGLTFNEVPGVKSYIEENCTSTGGVTNTIVRYHNEKPNIIYYGDIVSYDGGVTWNSATYTIKAVSPINNDVVYSYVTNDGMYKSSDCAKTWEKMCGTIDSAQRIVPDSEIMDRLYVGSFKRGFAIVDNGVVTYKGIADGLSYGDNNSLSYYEIAQDPNDPNHLVTSGHGGIRNSKGAGIHESFDRGETWNYVCEVPGSADAYRVRYHLDGKRVFITTSSGTFVYMPEKYKQYKDIIYSDLDNYFAKNEIETLYKDGVLDQYHNGLFNPDKKVYRWEFAKAITNALDLNSDSYKQKYSDIEQISKHYFYTAALCENNISDVMENGKFRPYDFLKYSEFENMAKNIRKKLNKAELDLDVFGLNLSDDTFVTREEMAYLLYQILYN